MCPLKPTGILAITRVPAGAARAPSTSAEVPAGVGGARGAEHAAALTLRTAKAATHQRVRALTVPHHGVISDRH